MFILTWFIVGVILMTTLIVGGHKLAYIENSLARRLALVLVTIITWPAFACLTSADYFIQFMEGDIQSAKEAVRRVTSECTIGLYHDIKETW